MVQGIRDPMRGGRFREHAGIAWTIGRSVVRLWAHDPESTSSNPLHATRYEHPYNFRSTIRAAGRSSAGVIVHLQA